MFFRREYTESMSNENNRFNSSDLSVIERNKCNEFVSQNAPFIEKSKGNMTTESYMQCIIK